MIADEGLFRRICSHVVTGLEGPRLGDEEAELLEMYPPAGVIIFSRNVIDAPLLLRLTSRLSGIARESGGPPMLLMADHEGGRTSVLADAIGTPPSQMAAARAASAGERGAVREVFTETARRMLSVGLNMMLSPVADVNSEYLNPVIGTRSFSERRDQAAEAVVEAVSAMKEAGILTSLKHFPGHGSTAGDSHEELPVTARSLAGLRERDVTVFEAGIGAGADSVMTAHIAPPDRMIPSSLDSEVIGGILRGEAAFDGVVLTDGLEMSGILTGSGLVGAASSIADCRGGDARPLRPACVMRSALEAGNDILLFTRPAAEVYSEIAEVLGTLEGDLGFWAERFPALSEVSLERVSRLRAHAAGSPPEVDAGRGDAYERCARLALSAGGTVSGSMLPAGGAPPSVLFCGERSDFGYNTVRRFAEEFLGALGRPHGFDPARLFHLWDASSPGWGEGQRLLGYRPEGPGAAGAGNRSPSADILVFMNRRPVSRDDIRGLAGSSKIVVVAEWPWASESIREGTPVVVTYGISEASARAAARVITGEEGCPEGRI